jgi:dTDP-4-amino-4,6-dideoxygalactose transaminase
VERRRANFEAYRSALVGVPGIAFMPEAPYGRATRWLTVVLIDPAEFGATREEVRQHLESLDIESRPVWKPMHLQPVFRGCRVVGGGVAADLFDRGLCLPSGTQMTDADVSRVVEGLLAARGRSAPSPRPAAADAAREQPPLLEDPMRWVCRGTARLAGAWRMPPSGGARRGAG